MSSAPSSATHSNEPAVYPPPADAVKNAYVSGMAAYDKLVAQAEADHAGYWAHHARELLSWKKPFTKTLNDSNPPFFKWFEDGTLNASYNLSLIHISEPTRPY